MTETPDRDKERGMRMAGTILNGTGFLFLVVGAVGLAKPELGSFLFGDDVFLLRVFFGALMVVGASDMMVARYLFHKTERK